MRKKKEEGRAFYGQCGLNNRNVLYKHIAVPTALCVIEKTLYGQCGLDNRNVLIQAQRGSIIAPCGSNRIVRITGLIWIERNREDIIRTMRS